MSAGTVAEYRSVPWERILEINMHIEALEERRLLSAGVLDPTFGTLGKTTTDILNRNDTGSAMVVDGSDNIFVAGSTATGNQVNSSDFALTKYNSNGTLVPSGFGGAGKSATDFFGNQDEANAIALQTDGKIILAGRAFYSDGINSDFAIARYKTDGTLDTNFGTGGKVVVNFLQQDNATGVVMQGDKILVVGTVSSGGAGSTQLAIVRLNSNGSVDTTYGTNGMISSAALPAATGAVLDGSQRLLVTATGEDFTLMRFTSTGQQDGSFGTGGVATVDFAGNTDTARALVLQGDKIVVAGDTQLSGPLNTAVGLARFNSNGTIDSTFGSGGTTTLDFTSSLDQARSVALTGDGKIVTAGFTGGVGAGNFAVARFNGNGTVDTTWGNAGKITTDFSTGGDNAAAVALQSTGKIVAAGLATGTTTDIGLARYNFLPAQTVGIFRNGGWAVDSDAVPGYTGGDSGFTLGTTGDKPVVGDWNGVGKERAGIFRDGTWILDTNGIAGFQVGDAQFTLGQAGDKPVVGDWNGDGKTDIGVFRDGLWILDSNGTIGFQGGDAQFGYGQAGDVPIIGDWNGDGKSDVGVFRNGGWALDSDGTIGASGGDAGFDFGLAGDVPIVGDWKGVGRSDIGVYRNGGWAFDDDGTRGYTGGDSGFAFGLSGDLPILGDWVGSGATRVGVYRNGGWSFDNDATRGYTGGDSGFAFGLTGDIPVVANW
ncbi:MAG: hypothetical protein IT447_05285 [Phycisphaerales bacterium]|nr:hypothetical protein [Phycisphaerales bacterium]